MNFYEMYVNTFVIFTLSKYLIVQIRKAWKMDARKQLKYYHSACYYTYGPENISGSKTCIINQ